jgi:ABC-type multidrug transport system fused ATPase/permease subunit
MTTTLANLIRSSSSCIFGTYNILSINPQLMALSLGVAPLVGAVALASRKYLSKVLAVQQEAAMTAASFVEERLNHMAMVKMSNREQDEVDSYHKLQDSYNSLGRKAAMASGVSMGILFSLGSTALCGILLAGRKAVEKEKMTSGQLTSFGTYSFMLALGTAGVVRAMSEYSKGLQSGTRLYKLIWSDDRDGRDARSAAATATPGKTEKTSLDSESVQSIAMEHVDFSYRSNPEKKILRDLSFQLSRGEVVALVGKNGSGKSSAAALLTGMYTPSKGKITVHTKSPIHEDHVNYSADIDRRTQAKLVQVVPQQPALFNMTVLENVRYSHPDATEDDIMAALKSAHGGFVNDLDGKLQYQVGRGGSRLSGGQRQKIGLARALLADPVFLILDEPNSSMDVEAETALNDTLKACRESSRGLLIVTHRAKTLEIVDRVLVMKDGHVVEEGTMAKLQQLNGEFSALMPDLE